MAKRKSKEQRREALRRHVPLSKARKRKVKKTKLELLAPTMVAPEFLFAMRRAILESGARIDSCILSTRMYVDLAIRMGFRCAPMVVEACAMNVTISSVAEEIDGYAADYDDEIHNLLYGAEGDPYMVILGAEDRDVLFTGPPDPNKWPGHLVAVIDLPGPGLYAVDLSLDQAARPKKRLLCRPAAFPVNDEWCMGEKVCRLRQSSVDGDLFIDYQARPEESSYEDSPDWQRRFSPTFTQHNGQIVFTLNPREE